MSTQEHAQLHHDYVMATYVRNLCFVRGQGCRVWDAEGREFLDFLGGIAVVSVGHCHPRLAKAIADQAGKLMHVSNLYFNEHQGVLAKALVDRFGGPAKVFFCNSGAEANEGQIKLARAWGHASGRYEIVSMRNSFHGRTLATLTATGQAKVQKGYDPLPAGFVYADYNDLASVEAAVTDKTVAILVEPVQGEGGVKPADPAFLQGLRDLCDRKNLLLMMDEVQTGVGRTGHWFGFQAYGVKPDCLSLAKGLGGGFPIGAFIAGGKLMDVLQAGSHGTTFGGTPLACAAALAVLGIIEDEKLVANATARGAQFRSGLERIAKPYPWIEAVRGLGLMVGLVLNQPAKELEKAMAARGLLAIATADKVIRFLPPLTVTADEVDRALAIVEAACAEFKPVAG
jgi:predicted acetylornithine/succinylornithine family transaminase